MTSASNFPDRLRVIKTVDVFPLRFKLKAEYLRRDRDLQCGISVRDSVLGGALRIESSTRTLRFVNFIFFSFFCVGFFFSHTKKHFFGFFLSLFSLFFPHKTATTSPFRCP